MKVYGIRFNDDNKIVWFGSRDTRDFYLNYHYKGEGVKVYKEVRIHV